MSFLKQLLTPFVEFEGDKNEAGNKPAATQPKVEATEPVPQEKPEHPLITGNAGDSNVSEQVPRYSPAGTIAAPLPEHIEYFEKLIDNANASDPVFSGADFKEFIDSKGDIDDISDDSIKYETAFNILKSQGLTKKKLIATGQEYQNIVGRDLNAFISAHAQQYKKEIAPREALLQQKAGELQVLMQRVNTLKTEINQLTQEITLTKEKLDTTRNSFVLAGENKQKEIELELQKIARYFQVDPD